MAWTYGSAQPQPSRDHGGHDQPHDAPLSLHPQLIGLDMRQRLAWFEYQMLMNLLAMVPGGFYPALHGSPLEPECGFDRGDRAAMRHQCQHQDDSRFRDEGPSGLVVGRTLLGPASDYPDLTVKGTPTSTLNVNEFTAFYQALYRSRTVSGTFLKLR
jgi:hypothetical protein